MEMHEMPQAYPRLRTWTSGVAVGLVAATFAWVQWGPTTVETRAASTDGTTPLYGQSQVDPGEEAVDSGDGGPTVRTEVRPVGDDGPSGGGLGEADGPAGPGVDLGAGSGDRSDGPSASANDTTGASDTSILLGATVAEGGIAEDFLGQVRHGINAVRNRVNAKGGIHGRKLEVKFVNDNWEPDRGQRNIETLIVQDKVFAFAVSPSSEGLNAASKAGLFERHGVPVVGADGLNNTQFLDRWIWPVAAATTTQVHVIMKEAWDRCEAAQGCGRSKGGPGLQPGIVFGNTYRFGVEGAFAFNGAYCRLTAGRDDAFSADGKCNGGDNIPGFSPGETGCKSGSRYCGVQSRGGEQYVTETAQLKGACGASGGKPACNFVLLLLEPASALSWMGGAKFPSAVDFERDGPSGGKCCGMAGAQPLFTSKFGAECGNKCNRMRVWTGYNPPIGQYGASPAVSDYTKELKAQSSTADINNQFTLGGYIGMKLLVEALDRVGPDLARSKLVETLNSMPALTTGLTNPAGLRWTTQERYANHSAQSFRIDYGNRFNGFQPAAAYTRDPWLGADNRPPGS